MRGNGFGPACRGLRIAGAGAGTARGARGAGAACGGGGYGPWFRCGFRGRRRGMDDMLTPGPIFPVAPSNKSDRGRKAGQTAAAPAGRWAREPVQAEDGAFTPSGVLVGVSGIEGAHRLERLPEGLPAFRILVVDDDASLRKACCEIAAGMGFVPLAAGSVSEALTVLRQQSVEMLLLDLKLPGGGGLKLLSEVKTLYPRDGRGGDDGVCHGRFRGGGDAHRGRRLSDQALCAGGADQRAGPVEPAAALRHGEPASARAAARADRTWAA